MRRFFATKAAETNRRRWGGGRECGRRWGRGQHVVRAILPGHPLNVLFLFVCVRFFPDVTRAAVCAHIRSLESLRRSSHLQSTHLLTKAKHGFSLTQSFLQNSLL